MSSSLPAEHIAGKAFSAASGLTCLVALLRLNGVAADATSLSQRSGLNAGQIGHNDLVRIARQHGLKSRLVEGRSWPDLAVTPLPAIAARRDGSGFFILVRLLNGKALILDGQTQKPDMLAPEELEKIWDGTLILITKRASLAELGQQFNIGWFMGAVHKYRQLLGEVLIACEATNCAAEGLAGGRHPGHDRTRS